MRKVIFAICVMILLSLTGCGPKVDVVDGPEKPIGGERDEHGCLGPAGYSWDKDIAACIRTWELEEDDSRKAAKTAVESLGQIEGLTVVEVLVARCPGCFTVKLSDADFKQYTVKLADWVVVQEMPEEEQPEDAAENTYYCTSRDRQAEACITLYKPVCADNGYTYSNGCLACMDPDVEYVVDGEC